MRSDVITEDGRRVSVVAHRTGERDIAMFDVDDPDACTGSVPLTDDEAAALAEVLGASLTVSRLSALGDASIGLYTEDIALPDDSGYLGRPLGDTKARTLTGTSIVASVHSACFSTWCAMSSR